jgi:hypothetical protein
MSLSMRAQSKVEEKAVKTMPSTYSSRYATSAPCRSMNSEASEQEAVKPIVTVKAAKR